MVFLSLSENVLLIVSGFGVMQGIFSALLLYFYPDSDRSVNRFLSLYVLALTLPIVLPLVLHILSWQVIIFIEPFVSFIPVFLYFYIRSFKEVITWGKAWPHLVFFIICAALAVWVYVAIGSKYPPSHAYAEGAKENMLLLIPFALRIVHRILYYFLSRNALHFYQRSILHLYSNITLINLNWMRWLINGFLFIIFSAVTVYFVMMRYPRYFDWCVLISGVVIALYVLMATFKGARQVTLWQVHPGIKKETLETEINNAGKMQSAGSDSVKSPGSQKNQIADGRIKEIAARIIALIEKEKIYREPELSLQDLAGKLKFPSYQVSQAINEVLKKNFYDLVNGYRVEEAKRLLLDSKNKNYTILSVGFEAGFNSKSTFNTVFKKFTGFTPTEYREKEGKKYLPV